VSLSLFLFCLLLFSGSSHLFSFSSLLYFSSSHFTSLLSSMISFLFTPLLHPPLFSITPLLFSPSIPSFRSLLHVVMNCTVLHRKPLYCTVSHYGVFICDNLMYYVTHSAFPSYVERTILHTVLTMYSTLLLHSTLFYSTILCSISLNCTVPYRNVLLI
jgi:hypothetical protein